MTQVVVCVFQLTLSFIMIFKLNTLNVTTPTLAKRLVVYYEVSLVLTVLTCANQYYTTLVKIHVLIIITCSNIEVTYNNKIHVLIIITCRYPSLV